MRIWRNSSRRPCPNKGWLTNFGTCSPPPGNQVQGDEFMNAKLLIAGLAAAASLMAQGPRGFGPGGPGGPGRGPGGPPQDQLVTGAPYSGVEVRSSSMMLT